MYRSFFPNSEFGWCFVVLVTAILVLAAYRDLRFAIIPKWLTLPLLASGLVANMIRGAWLAENAERLWLFETGNWLFGLLDGCLFALAGFVLGFALLFLFWILGTCGGGDVKLFAGLGAWTGPIYVVFVLVGSMFIATLLMIGKFATGGLTPAQMRKNIDKGRRRQAGAPVSLPRNRMTYSLPVAVATLVVLLWFFRYELRLTPPPTYGPAAVESAARFTGR